MKRILLPATICFALGWAISGVLSIVSPQKQRTEQTESYNAIIVNRPNFHGEYLLELTKDSVYVKAVEETGTETVYRVAYDSINEALLKDNL